MSFELHRTVLTGDTPGTATDLYWYTAGPADAETRVHLQAALHADEQPGTMALHHLLPMLRDADAAGQLKAQYTIFPRSEEHTSELQSLMRISYAVFCFNKKQKTN